LGSIVSKGYFAIINNTIYGGLFARAYLTLICCRIRV